jgi:hypothetical protein
MNLVGRGGDDLPRPWCGLAARAVALICPTAGSSLEVGADEATGAAVAVFGMASSSAAAASVRARRTEAVRRRRRPFPEPRGLPSKVTHPPALPALDFPQLLPGSPAHDRAAHPDVNSKRLMASKLVEAPS